MKKNCIVAQSGGPTVAINASLAGVAEAAHSCGSFDTVYGAVNGVSGILGGNYINLTELIHEDPANLNRLKLTPAMYLGSCRFKLPDFTVDESPYQTIFSAFRKLNVGAFFYIGGNDSMDTVLKLSGYAAKSGSDIRILGIPKTIDNDLCETDHTPGFGSAAKYIAASMLETAHDTYIYDLKSVTIVEIMGRDAGWLTAASALARNDYSGAPHLIYLPEAAFDKDEFLEDLEKLLKTHNHVIVAVSEGIRDKSGAYISASSEYTDNFGHVKLNGAGKTLEEFVLSAFDVKVRSLELSVLQRCASHMASKTDIAESFLLGKKAVELSLSGVTGAMACIRRTCNSPYTVEYESAPIDGIANEAKSIPRNWINARGNDIMPALLDYLKPLIIGEPELEYKNGLPLYLPIGHLSRFVQ